MEKILGDEGKMRLLFLAQEKWHRSLDRYEEDDFEILWDTADDRVKGEVLARLRFFGPD